MIICRVCDTKNQNLAVVCSSCGGYLQTRADALDLFTTAFSVLESPRKAFHKISIARHKNYVYPLSAVAGFAFVFLLFWFIRAGEYSESLLNILSAGLVIGPFFGMAIVVVYSFLIKLLLTVQRRQGGMQSILAVTAYALVPVVCSVILVLPVEIMTFGVILFSRNPSPYMLKPTSTILLAGLDLLFSLWSVVLLVVGVKVLSEIGWLRSIVTVVSGVALLVLILMGLLRALPVSI